MKQAVLFPVRFGERLRKALAERYDIVDHAAAPSALPAETAERVEAVITLATLGNFNACIESLPKLRLIAFHGTGYESADPEAAKRRGVFVTHSPGANASSVADVAMGLLIASARRMVAADAFLRAGQWGGTGRVAMPAMPGLTGKRLGIYGLGAIGRKIAARAEGFEVEIGYHNRSPRTDVPYRYFDSLMALAAWADLLMVAVRADQSNRHAVNAEVLKALGPEGHVVNISRGVAIDEEALIEALENGVIAGAGLDVYEHEPKVPERLIALTKNTVLTPHIGGASLSAVAAMQDLVIANVVAVLSGKPPLTPIPPLAG
jgi:hydroxypyruvate reductase